MSEAKLLLSGLLVASGLILGAFTLHGYFDPRWPERQAAAAGQRSPASVPGWTTSVDNRSRVMSIVSEGAGPSKPGKPAPKAKAAAKPPSRADADAEKARRRLAAKKLAEKRKADEAQKAERAKGSQQATFQWPWNWLGN